MQRQGIKYSKPCSFLSPCHIPWSLWASLQPEEWLLGMLRRDQGNPRSSCQQNVWETEWFIRPDARAQSDHQSRVCGYGNHSILLSLDSLERGILSAFHPGLPEVSLVKCCHVASANQRLQTVVRVIASSFVQHNAHKPELLSVYFTFWG